MSKLTKKDKLNALKAIRYIYRQELIKWLQEHNKKGIRYTKRARRIWTDDEGFNHIGEREWCEPMTIKFDGEITDWENTLPWLKTETMNTIFRRAGLGAVDFEKISKRHTWFDRLVDYFDDTYKGDGF